MNGIGDIGTKSLKGPEMSDQLFGGIGTSRAMQDLTTWLSLQALSLEQEIFEDPLKIRSLVDPRNHSALSCS
jgi:hypothetical protein